MVTGTDGVDADGREWLRAAGLGPGEDQVTGSGDAECGRLPAVETAAVAAGEERVECGEAPGSPLLAAAAGGTVVELTSSWGEGEAAAAALVVAETARAAATGLSALAQP